MAEPGPGSKLGGSGIAGCAALAAQSIPGGCWLAGGLRAVHGVDNPRGTYRPAQLTVPSTHGPSASKGKSGLAAFRRQCRLATVRFDPQVKGIQVNDIEELQKKVSDLEAMVLAAFAAGITTRVNAAGTIKLTIGSEERQATTAQSVSMKICKGNGRSLLTSLCR